MHIWFILSTSILQMLAFVKPLKQVDRVVLQIVHVHVGL